MPVRFTSPSLGGQRTSFIGAGEWQVGVAYRRLTADEWYVGTQVNEARAPFGQPLYLNINSLDFSVSYGLSDRLSLTLTLPLSYGTHSRFYADTARHKVSAHGLRDVNLVCNLWLLDPKVHVAGNVALALGISLSLGGRIDGIPQGDLIGGRDNSCRRPGYSLYLDPGIALRRGDEEFVLSVPVRVHQDFQRSSIDQQRSFTGGGDLAEYLIFLGYTHRF